MLTVTSAEVQKFENSLYYLSVTELKAICENLGLSTKATKVKLIEQVLFFIEKGEPPISQKIPDKSKAKKGFFYPLKADTLILKGAYKNDLQTRSFFKTIIGPHFHFTAYGIDWIKQKWLEGNPPTYQEFAEFWEKERKLRMHKPALPKKEWAYINFTQDFLKKFPHSSKDQIIQAWKKERLTHKQRVEKFLEKI